MLPRRHLLTVLPGLALAPAWGAEDDAVQVLRRGGVALLLRHAATVPGLGDPPGYRLDDCRTQRNLSEEGRAQARRIGAWLDAARLRPSAVRSSRWCRCLDTARIAFGRAEPWDALDSFFDDRSVAPARTQRLSAALLALPPGRFEAWVTHQVNIAALVGDAVAMGEGLVVAALRGADGHPAVRIAARLRIG
jgi:phosphohistidine phosphatase SixA